MLSTPEFTRMQLGVRSFLDGTPRGPEIAAATGARFCAEALNYGRLARSHEHSPGFAVPGSESRHVVQVRRRTKDSRFQAGQPLALQKIEAGPVDGREVKPDGSEKQEKTQGGCQSCRAIVKAGTCLDSEQKRLLVWMWVPPASRPWN